MKKLMLPFVLGLLIISHSLIAQDWVSMMQNPKVNFFEVQKAFNKYYEKAKAEKEKESKGSKDSDERMSEEENEEMQVPGYAIYKRWEWYMSQRVSETGERPAPDAVWKAMEEYKNGNRTSGAGNWTYIGNTSVTGLSGAGRVNFVRVHPTNPSIIFVGSPAGGLWKSTDGGSTWGSNTDWLAQTIGCSDIAINPTNTNIMYLATGDAEASDTYSVGLLKSTDGGATWNPTGFSSVISQTQIMSRVLINPSNVNIILVATSAGVYRSTDAAATFTKVLTGSYKDMEFAPGYPNTVYACGAEFYKSTNNGVTWTKTTSGLPAVANISRMAFAVTAADPTYVYLIAGLPGPAYGTEGFYKSTNSGVSFTRVGAANAPNIGTQQWYDLAIAACPGAKDEVLLGGQTQFLKSTNGGSTWSTIGANTHVDYHDLIYTNNTTCYVTSDGGVWSSTDNGANWTNKSNGLPISQIYGFGQSTTTANLQIHGWQDNGTSRFNGSWYQAMGGDGMLCFISWNNNNNMWGSQYEGSLNKSTNGGTSWTACKGNITGTGAWVTPWCEDPVTANTIYAGFNDVWKHTSGGGTTGWVKISNLGLGTTTLTQLAVSPADNKVIWATGGGQLFKTSNGGTSWITIGSVPPGTITYIACHNTNAQKAWITYSGFNGSMKVFQTNDQGVSWTNLSNSLPNIPVNCITYVKGSNDGIYIGTDVGAYYRDASFSTWQPFSAGLPNVAVSQISIYYPTNKIRCSTYGRGMWESDFYVPGVYPPVANFTSVGSISCPGAGVKFTDQSSGPPTSWKWSFPGGTPSTSTTQNPYVGYNSSGTYPVTLITTNSAGADTITYNSYVTIATSSVAAPVTTGGVNCSVPGVVNLSATGSGTGALRWWDAAGGGNIVATGPTYSPTLSATTTFYVDQVLPAAPDDVISVDNTIGAGASFTANDIRGLYFDVLSPIILNSVVVYAGSDGDRTIEVLDPLGNTLMDTTQFVAAGAAQVFLNFKIYPGKQYFIKCRGLVDLFRNTAGAVYPYTSSAVNITESNASLPGYFYFFYNWQYSSLPCNTERTPVTGSVGCTSIEDVFTNGSLNVFPNPNEGTFDLTFKINTIDNYTINIFNSLGQSVYKESLKNFSGSYSKKIDITRFGAGIYMMSLSNSKNESFKKIITN